MSPFEKRFPAWFWPATTLLIVFAFWSGTLRFDATPHGDGTRIMMFTDFLRGPGPWLKQWDPFRHGGFPVFANPEGFWIAALFVESGSPWANFLLNLFIYAHLVATGWLAWLVARRFALSPYWAMLAAVTITINQYMVLTEGSARIARLLMGLAFLVTIYVLQGRAREPVRFIWLTLAFCVAVTMKFYYAVFFLVIIWEKLLLDDDGRYRIRQRILPATGYTLAVFGVGLLLSGFWTVPIVLHHLQTFSIPAHGAEDSLVVPRSFLSLLDMALPIGLRDKAAIEQQLWPFLSLLLVPAAVVLAYRGYRSQLSVLNGYLLSIAFGLVYVAMGLPLIGDWVRDIYNALPIVSRLRHSIVASQIWVVFVPIAACVLMSAAANATKPDNSTHPGRLWNVLAAVLGVAAAVTLAIGVSRSDWLAMAGGSMLGLVALGAALSPLARRRQPIDALAGTLTLLSVALLVPPAFTQIVPGTTRPLHFDNRPMYPQISAVIEKDPDPYFRVHRNARFWIPDLDATERSGLAFNFYFPEEYAYSHRYMSAAYALDRTRPHWIESPACHELDAEGLALFSIKYLICNERKDKPAFALPGWSKIVSEKSMTLFRNDRYQSGIRLYCRWDLAAKVPPQAAREPVLEAVKRGVLLVTGAPRSDGLTPTATCPATGIAASSPRLVRDVPGRMSITTESAQPGYLVVPDNYHAGWHATIDGRETPVVRGNFAYIAVAVGPGRHQVVLEFTDPYLGYGTLSTLLGMLAMTGVAGFGMRNWRRSVRGA